MSSAASTGTTLLPNKSEDVGFRRLVFDRQRAFMVMELYRMREALMSSEAIIAKFQAGEDAFNTIFCNDKYKMFTVFEKFYRYIVDTAYGDAALRWAGHLPSVPAFAPGQSLFRCGCCEQGGHTQTASMMDNFRSLDKINFSDAIDFTLTKYGRGPADLETLPARFRLEQPLRLIESEFGRMTEMLLKDMDYPYHDLEMISDEADFYALIEEVEPLPASLADGLGAMDPLTYSMDQLEQLRLRGQALRNGITRLRRLEGNAHWEEAIKAEDSLDEYFALSAAARKWQTVVLSGGMEAAAACSNLGALYLRRENYDMASKMAGSAANECRFCLTEPAHYTDWRRASATSFCTGQTAEIPVEARRQLTQEQYVACKKLEWKSAARAFKAHVQVSIGAVKKRDMVWAQLARKLAHLDYRTLSEGENSPPPPKKELEAFEMLFRKRMQEIGETILGPLDEWPVPPATTQ